MSSGNEMQEPSSGYDRNMIRGVGEKKLGKMTVKLSQRNGELIGFSKKSIK